MDTELQEKHRRLSERLTELESCLVAFSGGVDSTLLLAVAAKSTKRLLAVTVSSPFVPRVEVREAAELATRLGAEHLVVEVEDLLEVEELRHNPPDRCYHCKKLIMNTLVELARERGFKSVIEGSNSDDSGQYRPGKKALAELGILSPMLECGLSKEEIRQLSRELELPTWDKPAMACLATRFPYGEELGAAALARVARAEAALREVIPGGLRLRCHGEVARLEVSPDTLPAIAGELRSGIVDIIKGEGFAYATLDLEGYRFGAMDENLTESKK